MVRVRVEPRVREVHAADPVDRRDAARATARSGHAAGDEVRAVRALERVVGRVEQQAHVRARARRAELPVLVRLVPDHPAPHVGIALRRRVGEVRERARALRRPVRGAAAVGPARRADERHDRRDAARAQPAEQDVAGGPAVRRVEMRRRLRRTLRRDLVPAQVDADDVDAERVDLVEPLVERPRPPEQPRVVLDPVLNVGGGIRACLENEERTERDDRREHDSKHAANVATPCFQVVSLSSGLRERSRAPPCGLAPLHRGNSQHRLDPDRDRSDDERQSQLQDAHRTGHDGALYAVTDGTTARHRPADRARGALRRPVAGASVRGGRPSRAPAADRRRPHGGPARAHRRRRDPRRRRRLDPGRARRTPAPALPANGRDPAQPHQVWYRSEIEYGPFEREVSLAVDVDASRASATYERGLLRVVLPVAERAPSPARLTIAIRRIG